MELNEAINKRRSLRNYLSKEVDIETLKKIINAGIMAPSAKNLQPWYYIIVTNQELKNKIANLLDETNIEKKDSLSKTVNVIKTVPALILVFNKFNEDTNDWFSMSIGASIENMLLSAKSYNLDTLWIGYIQKIENEIKHLLNVDMKLLSAIAVGYGIESVEAPKRNTNVYEIRN